MLRNAKLLTKITNKEKKLIRLRKMNNGLLTGASKSTNANTCMHHCGAFSRKFENKMVTFPRAMKNDSLLAFAKAMRS